MRCAIRGRLVMLLSVSDSEELPPHLPPEAIPSFLKGPEPPRDPASTVTVEGPCHPTGRHWHGRCDLALDVALVVWEGGCMQAVVEQGTLFPLVESHAPRRSWLREFMDAVEIHGPMVFRSHVPLVLDVSRSRVHQLIEQGRIATVQIRGREYVPVAALESYWADERKNGRPSDSEARELLLAKLTGRKNS